MHISSVIIHYIDDIMILETKVQARTDLNAMVTHITKQGWLINPAKSHAVKFLGTTWAGATRDTPQSTKNKLLSLPTPRTKQEQYLVGWFGFWRMNIPHLGILLALISKTTRKDTTFEWGPEQKQTMSELQKVVVSPLVPLGPYDPRSNMILEVSAIPSSHRLKLMAKANERLPAVTTAILDMKIPRCCQPIHTIWETISLLGH